MPTASYDLRIDWNGNGSFSDTGDNVNADLRPNVTITYGRDQSRALSPTAVGTITFELNNLARAYSPENTSSPLNGYIVPARPLRFNATYSGRTRTLFKGYLDEFTLSPARNEKRVSATGLDALSLLKESKAYTELFPAVRTGEAIGAILEAIGWPPELQDIDPGATFSRWWCVDGQDAWTAITDLVKAEGPPALLSVNPDGSIVFRDRHHRLFTTLNPNPTFSGTVIGWNQFGGTLSFDSTQIINGSGSAKFVPDGVTAITGFASDNVPVTPGVEYTAQGWLRRATAGDLSLNVNWFNSSGTYLFTSANSATAVAGQWTFYMAAFTAPAGAATATIIPTMGGTPSVASVMNADDVRLYTPSVSVATFRDTGAEPLFSAPVDYDQGWRDVYNAVETSVDIRTQSTERSVVWSSDSVYSVPNGQTEVIEFQTSDPFYDAIPLEVDVDYRTRSGAPSVTLSRTSGRSATISIAAFGDSVVDKLQVRAFTVPVSRTVQVKKEKSTSITTYGRRVWPDSLGDACLEDVKAVTDLVLDQRSVRLPILRITVIGSEAARLTQCLDRNLSDRVTVVESETGLNRSFFVEQIQHEVPLGGLFQKTTFGLEAVPSGIDSGVFIFDHPTLGKFGTGKFAR